MRFWEYVLLAVLFVAFAVLTGLGIMGTISELGWFK